MEKALETKDMTIMIADIGVSLANALRRSSSEIPILAIDEVDIYQNDSALTDEILAHRIGLVPLKNQKTKKDKFVELKLKVSAKEPTYVLSKELQGDIVFDEVPLVYIDKGQSIEVVGKARQGLGKDHAKFSPGLVYYYHLSDVKVSKDGEKNLELAELHPEVFENKSGKLVVKNSWACNFDQEDIEDFNGVEVEQTDKIVYIVESWGQITPSEIVIGSAKALSDNLAELEKALK